MDGVHAQAGRQAGKEAGRHVDLVCVGGGGEASLCNDCPGRLLCACVARFTCSPRKKERMDCCLPAFLGPPLPCATILVRSLAGAWILPCVCLCVCVTLCGSWGCVRPNNTNTAAAVCVCVCVFVCGWVFFQFQRESPASRVAGLHLATTSKHPSDQERRMRWPPPDLINQSTPQQNKIGVDRPTAAAASCCPAAAVAYGGRPSPLSSLSPIVVPVAFNTQQPAIVNKG
jgi:hypothetical protein